MRRKALLISQELRLGVKLFLFHKNEAVVSQELRLGVLIIIEIEVEQQRIYPLS